MVVVVVEEEESKTDSTSSTRNGEESYRPACSVSRNLSASTSTH